jgi:excisionase family DNA binding protein
MSGAVRLRAEIALAPEDLEVLAEMVTERVLEKLGVGDLPMLDTGSGGGYLNTDQAARYLACSRQRIYDLVSSGRLPVAKDGGRSVYRREDLDALITIPWPQRGPR